MLIDTKQVIPVTDLRLKLSQIIDAVYQGKTFIVTEKGKIKAKIVPVEKVKKSRTQELLKEIRKLREENDRYYKKSGEDLELG